MSHVIFNLKIKTVTIDANQKWLWFGEMNKNNKVLRNFDDYTTDTFLLMNKDNQIVGGYEYIYNSSSTITVKELTKETQ